MASAADIRHPSASPSANPPRSSTQNSQSHGRPNALACEIPVVATGARPSDKGGQRELFTEDTTTALVFPSGGVLRLSAKVDPGQLLFLTHKETKQEVVAQVTRKRDFRPGICYVEVEFTEPSRGFWGVKFPESPDLATANAQQRAAAESAQAVEDIIAEEPREPVAAPSDQEVTALKFEVEVLREQLKLFQKQTAPPNSSAPAAETPAFPSASAGLPAEAPFDANSLGKLFVKLEPAAARGPSVEVSGAPNGIGEPPVATPPEPDDGAKPPFSAQDLLPKPHLHLEAAKPPAKSIPAPEPKAAATRERGALRKDILFAAFVLIVAGAAWYQNLLPSLPHLESLYSRPAPAVATLSASRAAQKAANAPANPAKSAHTAEARRTPPLPGTSNAFEPAPPEGAKPATPEAADTAKSNSGRTPDAARAPEKSERKAPPKKRPASSSKTSSDSVALPSEGGVTVPPKLIKSVRAVARPDALQDFATGNASSVTFDALVDVSGRVKSMRALSGSAPLQKAAAEALKQYVYEPATRHGTPVPARVKVTIKLVFEP